MSFKKLSNNKYKISVELGYDILGNRKRKTEIFNGSFNDMKLREAELTKEYYHIGNVRNVNDLTFEQYSEIFLNKYCKENISLVTMYGYEEALERILPIIGKVKLNKITPLMLDSMYQQLKVGKSKRTLGYHSMYAFYKLINVMFNQAIKWELVDKNPNLKATKPKKEKKERRFYDLQQIDELLKCLENESIKYRALITLALDSGARRSEICALKWNDINFDTHTLRIDNSLKVVRGVVDEGKTKTPSSNRVIILNNGTIEILKEYKKWQDEYKKQMGKQWKGANRVFISKFGGHMNPDTCSKIINKIVKKYGLDDLTFHELRHTSATYLINKGMNPKAVSERLGHSDTSVTMEIYSHTFEHTKKECANAFDEIFRTA